MFLLVNKVVPLCLALVLLMGCNASRRTGTLAIPLELITPPQLVTTVTLADYSVRSAFTDVVHVVRLPDGQFLALSATDPNQGCTVPWNEQAQVFWNPCHGAKYNIQGDAVEGPAVRGLDRFYVRVSAEHRKVYVDVAASPVPGEFD